MYLYNIEVETKIVNGSINAIHRDEFPATSKLSAIIDNLLKCKKGFIVSINVKSSGSRTQWVSF
jgi:hypothetical protein